MEKNIDIRQKSTDCIVSIVLLLFCTYLFLTIRDYSPYGAVFPNALAILLAFFSGLYFLKSFILLLRAKASTEEEETYRIVEDYPSFLIAFPLTILYIFVLLSFLGFLTSSVVFAASMIITITIIRKEHSWKKLLLYFLFALFFSSVVYYIFRYLLLIRLPTGMFI